MTRFARSLSLAVVLSVSATSTFAADERQGAATSAADRASAAKECQIDLHDGLEALAEHRVPEAERCLKRALARAKVVGPESLEMAQALSGLGALALIRKEYAEAESLLVRSLSLLEKTLGPNDTSVGATLHNLAGTMLALKKYDEAEPIALRALAIREDAPNADAEEVADTLDILALIYAFQDKVPRSEEVFRRALAVREKAQGADHPDLARALMNMAAARVSLAFTAQVQSMLKAVQGGDLKVPERSSDADFRAAEALLKRALAIREKALGPEHPDTIDAIDELASCYELQGNHAGADPLLHRILTLREKALGPDDPKVAEALDALAVRAMEQGKYREAQPLLRRALAIQEKARAAKPDYKEAREAAAEYSRELRQAVRSAEVMDDPARRPTEDDRRYLNGLEYATEEPTLASLFNSRAVQVLDGSIGDAGLVHLRGLVNAEDLHIDAKKITDVGLVHLEPLTNLKKLILIGSRIRGPGLAHLKGMTDLEMLNLGASQDLDDAGIAHLPTLSRLKSLNLAHAEISDAGLAHLERFPALNELNVDGTKVTKVGIENLKRAMPGLKVIHTRHFGASFEPVGPVQLIEPPAAVSRP